MKYSDLRKFPEIKTNDRILVLAPHIDDEVISSAGIIQQAKQKKAEVIIVYATNGDDPLYTGIKRLLGPNWFISFGKKRMAEARKAAPFLSLNNDNLVFLGYPDNGLKPMFDNKAAFTSKSTRLNYSPYSDTYCQKQLYTGENLISDLINITADFKPTVVIVPHPKDNHPDHQSLFWFWQKAMAGNNLNSNQYTYLVHFKYYPPKRGWLRPPTRLAGSNCWYSFDLSLVQRQKKLGAIKANASQLSRFSISHLLKSLVRGNEIFEKID
ncbi:MAG: PIG-L family deacetylase [Desulfobacteraceae bacterium]|nr:PIG-L family deacetylase [Patescibacteria group bacterium]MBU4466999.1 PIG-L family deacetylase [Patescibacteria group bacterium]MCG2688715.1 PIG-L family deacetylase [Candidatus Parcubacteria bacterium]MCG2758006.1 PIG-L family deacetylase [Desulfobacteraceae bacterium]